MTNLARVLFASFVQLLCFMISQKVKYSYIRQTVPFNQPYVVWQLIQEETIFAQRLDETVTRLLRYRGRKKSYIYSISWKFHICQINIKINNLPKSLSFFIFFTFRDIKQNVIWEQKERREIDDHTSTSSSHLVNKYKTTKDLRSCCSAVFCNFVKTTHFVITYAFCDIGSGIL